MQKGSETSKPEAVSGIVFTASVKFNAASVDHKDESACCHAVSTNELYDSACCIDVFIISVNDTSSCIDVFISRGYYF